MSYTGSIEKSLWGKEEDIMDKGEYRGGIDYFTERKHQGIVRTDCAT